MSGLNARLSDFSFWKIAGLSFILGLLLATTFAPLHWVIFLPLCFSGLLILLKCANNKKQAFFIGWWFGWGQFIAGLYWVGVAFTIDANAHAALIPLPVLGLPAFLAIFTGVVSLATYVTKLQKLYRIAVFTGFWVLLEYARGLVFTGFPWNLAGYSWGNNLPMLQWTAFIGVYGLTLVTVLISSLPSVLVDDNITRLRKNTVILIGCFLTICMMGVGYSRITASPLPPLSDSRIRIVQPNISQADKWRPDLKFSHIRKLTELSAQENGPKPRYLIWPETAVPFFLTTNEKLKFYLQRFVPKDGALITGAPRKNSEKRQYWNSVQVLKSNGDIPVIYDKRHLVPYGEYLPLRGFLEQSGIASLIPALDQMSDFSTPAASAPSVFTLPDLGSARVLICYEIAFPWEVKTEQPFNWILNVTNDGWFGDTSGPYQHLVVSKVRGIEQGVSVIRAANTGVSAIINAYGKILQSLPLGQLGVIDGQIPAPIPGQTLYRKIGEALPLGLAFLLLGFGITGYRLKNQ
ncbi:MAG: apolipoprotein N-acyltransferase [Sneathiella sp.]